MRLGLAAAFAAGWTIVALAGHAAFAADKPTVRLGTTTTLEEVGLLAYLLPKFTADTGIAVHVLAVDAKRAFELGKGGEADALLLDDPASEQFFVSQRHALDRREVAIAEMLIAGPRTDPAEIGDSGSPPGAFKAIADTKAPFVSRGDGSGTHELEKRLWNMAGRVPETGAGTWYVSANGRMPATLALAGEKRAYLTIDRASWLAQRSHYGLIELVNGGATMENPISVLIVNDLKHKSARYAPAKKLADWLTGSQGRTLIARFEIADKTPFVVR
ncbi:MAG TPA: substrate-binding domain-containing protein [Myxococcota bacterium]|nr:substrate-binding domain-containing protein [Myxococcota bacterium]